MRRAAALTAAALGAAAVHRLGGRSGVDAVEATSPLPGDGCVDAPMWTSTRGITVAAPVERVWPWIVQMGYPTHRAGWYTPHLLDRLTFGIRARSSDVIRPELQHLAVGDVVPDSHDLRAFFEVVAVDPPYHLVLHSTRHVIPPIRTIDFSWAFVLRPLGPESTRLLIRARTRYTPWWARAFVEAVVGPADLVNVTGMLRGVRRRAEATPVRAG